MKVGYFHREKYPPSSGQSVYSWQAASKLIQRGHILYAQEDDKDPQFIKYPSGKIGAWRLAKEVDVLHISVHGSYGNEKFSLLKLARLFSLPVVWHLHSPLEEMLAWNPNSNKKSLVAKLNRRRKLLAGFVDAAICVSEEVQRYNQEFLGITRSYVVPNGSDPVMFNPENKEDTVLRGFCDKFKILWAGSARYPWQGVDIVVELAKRFIKIDKRVLFVVISGPSKFEFPVLGNLLVLNEVPYMSMPAYISSVDACLCVYHDINWFKYGFYFSPLKLYDYMASGKPVIASNLGQIGRVIVDNKNGLLNNDIDDMVKNISFLLNNPEHGKKLGMSAREDVIRYYNWERVAKEVEDILLNLLSNRET